MYETIRVQNVVVMAKLQSGVGVDANPGAGDVVAIEVGSLTKRIGMRAIESNETTGSLDDGDAIVAGAPSTVSFRMRLRGSGVAYTGSVRPPVHPILRACAMKDRLLAAVTAAALVAGGANAATLGSGFSSTAQEYRGAPLQITTGTAAHVGATPMISDYTAGKVATLTDTFSPILADTDSAQIPACVIYEPVTAEADIAYLSIDIAEDGKLFEFIDMRGTMKVVGKTGDILIADVTLTGTLKQKPTDAAVPDVTISLAVPPLLTREVRVSSAFSVDRIELPISTFEWDFGARLVSTDDPNTPYGFGAAKHTGRRMTVSCDPLATLVANADRVGDAFAGRKFTGVFRAGSTVSNRIAGVWPQLKHMPLEEAVRDELRVDNLNLHATGKNAGGMLCFF